MFREILLFCLAVVAYFLIGSGLRWVYIGLKGCAPRSGERITLRILGFLAHPFDLLREYGDFCYSRFEEPGEVWVCLWPFVLVGSFIGIPVTLTFYLVRSLVRLPRYLPEAAFRLMELFPVKK